MARIPNDQLLRIKEEISLLRLVESQGYQVTKQGKDYAIVCPFHPDKTPSCIISPKSNLFHCFGCGEGGSVIDWIMKTERVSFRHAVELLKSDTLSLAAHTGAPMKKTTVPKLDAPVAENTEDQAVLQQVMNYYHQTLKQSPEGQAYLAKRGLDDAALIDYFRLGYANRTLGLRLPQRNRKAGKELREQLQRIGLYRETGREHFAGSLVIPVRDEAGRVGEVYGRKLLDNLRKGTPKHTYLPGSHEGVFNAVCLPHSEEILLCESLIDALTFWRWGFRQVTTSYGTNGFTDELLAALVRHKVKRVLIAYDRDASGNKAALAVADTLNTSGIECFRLLFPKGMDVNDYACHMSPPQKSLALVIRKAEWMGKGKAPKLTTVANGVNGREITSSLAAKEKTEPVGKPVKNLVKPASNKPSPENLPEKPQEKQLNENATPVPALPASDVVMERNDNELFITLGKRIYRVRGLDSNTRYDQLKIQLLVRQEEQFHMDKLDLTSSKQRQVFINQASVELGVKDEVLKRDLGKVLLALEEEQAKQQHSTADKKIITLSPEAQKTALALLQDKNLLTRVLTDFTQAGVVGEDSNKLVGYIACVSRKLERPLAVIIQSSSAAGKSSLMDAILAFMPEEERTQYSAMTGQSLFYMGETQLKHKILAISEEEGASNASYALKLLQSEGEVTIASTGKDESTGNLVTKEYTVEGPVMLFLTTTAIDIDEELLNRCLVLTVNETREQTQAIHTAQRLKRTLQGLQNNIEKERIITLHRNAQRLLKPLAVINPYADQLTFLNNKTRTRRDHEKYLTLIDSIALLHQYQREIKTIQHNGSNIDYVEVTLDDIEIANRLAHDILGRTLDELPPQTRKLLQDIQTLVQGECKTQRIEQRDFRFSRKHIREATGWGNTQLKIHCRRLEDMEYLLVHRGGRGQSFEYELLYDQQQDGTEQHLMGLLDIETLRKQKKQAYDKKKSGVKEVWSGSSRPQVGGVSAVDNTPEPNRHKAYRESCPVIPETARQAV